MSIYKTPTTLWDCIAGKRQVDAVDETANRIIGLLQCAPDDWFMRQDVYGAFAAHAKWQIEYLDAAWRTLVHKDRVRVDPVHHYNKIQYRPLQERLKVITDRLDAKIDDTFKLTGDNK